MLLLLSFLLFYFLCYCYFVSSSRPPSPPRLPLGAGGRHFLPLHRCPPLSPPPPPPSPAPCLDPWPGLASRARGRGGESRERARPPRHRSPRSIPAGSYSNSAIPPGHAHTHAHTLTHTHAHPPLTPTRGRRGGGGGSSGHGRGALRHLPPSRSHGDGLRLHLGGLSAPPAGLRRVLWGAVGCQQDPSCHPPDPKVTAGPLLPVSCRASCQQPSG